MYSPPLGVSRRQVDPSTELKGYREAFQIFDRDGDGMVSTRELKQMMKTMGTELTDGEVRDIMKESGAASQKGITYPEFCRLMAIGARAQREDAFEQDMRAAFSLFDADRDGNISKKDMGEALLKFGVALTEKEVDQLIAEATMSDVRTVSFDVFKRVMLSGQAQ